MASQIKKKHACISYELARNDIDVN